MMERPRGRNRSAIMLHHIDIHVRDIDSARTLFDALAEHVGYRRVEGGDEFEEPGFVGYQTATGGRPRIGLIPDTDCNPGSMRLAFAVDSHEAVDAAAQSAIACGVRDLDGPAVHSEYGDYYAVFFTDRDGNHYEIVADAPAVRDADRSSRGAF
jgi:catechol 2,3-dioxygenase-like lactoylglutathione lyase family enzyme